MDLRKGQPMFNPTEILIEAFGERLEAAYWRTYGHLEPSYAGILAWAGTHGARKHCQ